MVSSVCCCRCIPPKKSKTMQKWVPANDPNGCPSDYYRVPFVCRLATASNVSDTLWVARLEGQSAFEAPAPRSLYVPSASLA